MEENFHTSCGSAASLNVLVTGQFLEEMSDLTELEQRRLANISRNEAFLSELGLEATRGNKLKQVKKVVKRKEKNKELKNESDNLRY